MTSFANAKQYEYFIVALTRSGKLVADTVTGRSFSYAYDTFLSTHDLAGQVAEYKFCIRVDKTENEADYDYRF